MSISIVTRGRLWPVGTFIVREQFQAINFGIDDVSEIDVDMTLAEEIEAEIEVSASGVTAIVESVGDDDLVSHVDDDVIDSDMEGC